MNLDAFTPDMCHRLNTLVMDVMMEEVDSGRGLILDTLHGLLLERVRREFPGLTEEQFCKAQLAFVELVLDDLARQGY